MIVQLIRTAIGTQAAAATERALSQGVADEERLESLQKALTIEANHDGAVQALRGQRAFAHEYYLGWQRGEIPAEKLVSDWSVGHTFHDRLYYLFPGMLLRGYPEALRFSNDAVRAAKLKGEAQREAFRKLEEGNPDVGKPWTGVDIVGAVKGKLPDQARMRCAVAALAAERYRLKHDHWPKGFADLLKEGLLKQPITDPYDSQPLRFHRTETGLIVYSLGEDKIDNQGKMDDIAFELWHPNFRAAPVAVEAPKK